MAKNDMVALRLSETQSAKLDALCDSAQLDRSSMIRLLIDTASTVLPAQVIFENGSQLRTIVAGNDSQNTVAGEPGHDADGAEHGAE